MRKLIRITAAVLFIVGLVFFAYPIVVKETFEIQADKAIEQFEQLKAENSDSGGFDKTDGENPGDAEIPYAELRQAMLDYNERLYLSGQSGLIDQLSYEKPDFLLSDYGIDCEILGYISIPSVDIRLPIYNGASAENMAKGAVYLAKTSLPVGGENTNCVIAAHNLYKGVNMFMKIPELNAGDEIYITNLWETLVYRVVETKVIDPDDSKNIYIQPGRSLLTLSTCYPYPDNSRRYLVYAELEK